mmetsp:Transcript_4587/g.6326  ORF Transcript_4587/g.6326 Transcript_4587/m.6326 type:complete len:113 (+) Transcript_4587:76-414(+)
MKFLVAAFQSFSPVSSHVSKLAAGRLSAFASPVLSRSIAIATSPYVDGPHRSNAEELIAKIPPIEVNGTVAVCDGGGGALGHPLEYIQLNTKDLTEPQTCKYCGLRYIGKLH